ncbi:hypothetical protein HDF26_000230 [Pedobacter cryoconitis]|uniref:hypothetical protein n=1 Tax=Pedobacter cryoconitis TaxID=188932 RepID=UPI00161EBE06|nr:hypothetical protein [Pedobacter cryoconitis]MBB6269803.1 hypothetical protein [Pedobacter cryoconitis]
MMNSSAIKITAGELDRHIDHGIDYLHEHQYPNGEFCCYYSPDDHMKEWCVPDSTVFPASLIAACLMQLRDSPKVKEILSLTAGFLSYQVMRGGVWNFFTKWNPLFQYSPADTDDTVFASYVLKSLQVDFIDNSKLLMDNRNSKGLFYTWFVLRPAMNSNLNFWKIMSRELKRPLKSVLFWFQHESSRNDIDAVVNANILFYFGLNEQTRAVVDYLLRIVADNKEGDSDKWYKNRITFYYFLSRNYKTVKELEPAKEPIIKRIYETVREDGAFGNSAFETALSISTLANFNHRDEQMDRAVDFLFKAQCKSGCWERHVFFYSGHQKAVGWGSEEIVTGYCLEALANYRGLLTIKS